MKKIFIKAFLISFSLFMINCDSTNTQKTKEKSQFLETRSVVARIEAENYYSMNGVQLEDCNEGGQNVGYIDESDWLEYSVNIEAAGLYKIKYRVASEANSGIIQFQLNGESLTSTVVTNTGGWQNWITVEANVELTAGSHTVRLYAVGAAWNINWFQLEVGGTIPYTPAKIEAESYNIMNGVQVEDCVEGGQNVGHIDTNDWLEYSVNIETAGSYIVKYRVASEASSGIIQFQLNGEALISTVVPNTGGWQNWVTVVTNIELTAGNHKIRLNAEGPAWNINWFELIKESDEPALNCVFVNINASGSKSGKSWRNAMTDLQAAIDYASQNNINEVWVAKGTYTPSSWPSFSSWQTKHEKWRHFSLRNNVAVYGGFLGYETKREERDFTSNHTILSGDLEENDGEGSSIIGTNSLNVFYHTLSEGLNSTAILDGVIISASNGSAINNNNSSPTVKNCTFRKNYARANGVVENYKSSAVFINCIFEENRANEVCGGMYNSESSLELQNCSFIENDLTAIYNYKSNIKLFNCKIEDNRRGIHNDESIVLLENSRIHKHREKGIYNEKSSALTIVNSEIIVSSLFEQTVGGSIYNSNSSIKMTDSTIGSSYAKYGGGICNFSGDLKIYNCKFENNRACGDYTDTYGGAIYNSNATVYLEDCLFQSNKSIPAEYIREQYRNGYGGQSTILIVQLL